MGSRGQHSNAGFAYGYPPTHQNPGVYSTHYGTPMPPQSSYDDQQDTPLPAPPAAIASIVHATHAPAPQYPPNAYTMLPATSVSYELTADGQFAQSTDSHSAHAASYTGFASATVQYTSDPVVHRSAAPVLFQPVTLTMAEAEQNYKMALGCKPPPTQPANNRRLLGPGLPLYVFGEPKWHTLNVEHGPNSTLRCTSCTDIPTFTDCTNFIQHLRKPRQMYSSKPCPLLRDNGNGRVHCIFEKCPYTLGLKGYDHMLEHIDAHVELLTEQGFWCTWCGVVRTRDGLATHHCQAKNAQAVQGF